MTNSKSLLSKDSTSGIGEANNDDVYSRLWKAIDTYDSAITFISGMLKIGTIAGPLSQVALTIVNETCEQALKTTAEILNEVQETRVAGKYKSVRAELAEQTSIDLNAGNALLPEEFVVFNLETTGLDHNSCEIIEIGAILVRREQVVSGNNEFASLQSLIFSTRPLPIQISRVTGITQETLDEHGVSLHDALEEFLNFVGKRRLVSYNAKFDMLFLNRALDKVGFKINNPVSCALKMARRAWPDRKGYKLEQLAHSVEAGHSHRAIADCIRAMVVYIAAVRKLHVVE